ncbi:JTB isoform X1 [Brachionus plicatilis]|uniref:JTB isoform X1 n=1 Tax=Brachionus plicatilis TaxID=10195 RepID=A0A3M7Q1W6_BRAPC|nr:JTB isoform X1 [Brachionus plicatilis]
MNPIFSIFESCNCISKRKLIAIFAAIIIIAITFLYFENFYNITYHSKTFFGQNTAIPNETELPDLETLETKKTDPLIKSINDNDKKIDQNSKKCWNEEKYNLVEACQRCDSLLRSSLLACKETGYREVISCESHGLVSRSCPVPVHILKKHYWAFEFTSLFICLVFTAIAKRRKRYLDHLATEKVRRQILSA